MMINKYYKNIVKYHSGLVGPIADRNSDGNESDNEFMISICEPIGRGGCVDRIGNELHPYICLRDRLSLNGSDAGSLLSFQSWNDVMLHHLSGSGSGNDATSTSDTASPSMLPLMSSSGSTTSSGSVSSGFRLVYTAIAPNVKLCSGAQKQSTYVNVPLFFSRPFFLSMNVMLNTI